MDNVAPLLLQTLGEGFSDLGDVAQFTRVLLRLLAAAALGGVLGYERESRGYAAGVRTHMLVALGAALFIVVPQQRAPHARRRTLAERTGTGGARAPDGGSGAHRHHGTADGAAHRRADDRAFAGLPRLPAFRCRRRPGAAHCLGTRLHAESPFAQLPD